MRLPPGSFFLFIALSQLPREKDFLDGLRYAASFEDVFFLQEVVNASIFFFLFHVLLLTLPSCFFLVSRDIPA